MIRKLKIRNILKHKQKDIDFKEGVNVLLGDTAAGKSSILRALYWLCFNRPQGDAIIHRGSGIGQIRALLMGGRSIIRRKGKGKNQYLIDGKHLSAIGTGIPEQIRDILNISDDNFQMQFDPHFWFSLSPGEVSKQLNKIVNLELIDRFLSKVASEIRTSKTKIQVSQERLEDAKEKVKEMAWIVPLKRRLDRWEKKNKKLRRMVKKRDKLQFLVNQVEEIEEKLKRDSLPIEEMKELGKKIKKVEDLENKRDRLQSLLDQMERTERECQKIERSVTEKETKLKKLKAKIKTCPACGQVIPNSLKQS